MTPPASGRLDRVLTLAAAVLLPLGLLVIGLGWYGAAHSPYLFEQVPYVISGGLLGLALATGAGLLYFGGWVARAASAQQRSAEQTLALLGEIKDALVGGTTHSSNGKAGFVATARGSMWHRPDCAMVAGRDDLRPVTPPAKDLKPCALCNPLSAVPLSA